MTASHPPSVNNEGRISLYIISFHGTPNFTTVHWKNWQHTTISKRQITESYIKAIPWAMLQVTTAGKRSSKSQNTPVRKFLKRFVRSLVPDFASPTFTNKMAATRTQRMASVHMPLYF